VHRLADGTKMGILEARDADRTGQVQRGPIEPDTPLGADSPRAAPPEKVLDWLAEESRRAPPTR